MFSGDPAHTQLTLVWYGFAPAQVALDNRPLMFDEFSSRSPPRAIFASATPSDLELRLSEGVVIENGVRPAKMVVDPNQREIRPVRGRIDVALGEFQFASGGVSGCACDDAHEAADVGGISPIICSRSACVRYMHSATSTPSSTVGSFAGCHGSVNSTCSSRHQPAARGLDLPEVSLVAILDAPTRRVFFAATDR